MKHANAIPNVLNACGVMKRLAQAPEGLSLAEVAGEMRIPRTSAFRILTTLCHENLIEKRDSRYFAGYELLRMGLLSLGRMQVRDVAPPMLRQVAMETGETAHLAVPGNDCSLIVEVCEGVHPIRAASRPGFAAELHASATGKVFLAAMNDEQVRTVLEETGLDRRTDNTLCTVAAVVKELAIIRRRGYAVDDEEFYCGVRCLAAPVCDARGQVVAAIGITGSSTRFTKARIAPVAEQVMVAAKSLSQSMGYSKEI